MTDLDASLDRLGDALHAGAAADLASPSELRPTRRAGRTARAKVSIALLAAALAVPAIGLATKELTTEQEVAEGLPNGSAVLIGTEPTCTAVREGIEYECVLAKAPSEPLPGPGPRGAPGEFHGHPGEWLGYVAVTVNDNHRVDGGCRSENADGTSWRCYLGEEAVRQKIIAQRFLGDYVGGPAVS